LPALEEAMLLGTTNDVMPVVQINNWSVGDGKPGAVTRRLQKALQELVAKEKASAMR
jgi:D-alanine transaminase